MSYLQGQAGEVENTGVLPLRQRDRDRLVALRQAHKRQISQRPAAEQIGCTERHLRRLLKKLKREGDKAVIHGLRGRTSNRKRSEKDRWCGFSRKRCTTASARRWRRSTWPTATRFRSGARHCAKSCWKRSCGKAVGARSKQCMCGASGGVRAANWCSGTLPITTDWKGAAEK